MPTAGGSIALAAVEADPRGLCLIGRGEQARALGRRLQRLGDDERDGLLGIAHAIVLQRIEAEAEQAVLAVRIERKRWAVRRRDHLDDARVGLGRRNVERGNAAAGNGADRHDGMQHAGGMVVGGIGRRTGDLEQAVAAGQRLAAAGTETDMRAAGKGRASGMGEDSGVRAEDGGGQRGHAFRRSRRRKQEARASRPVSRARS